MLGLILLGMTDWQPFWFFDAWR